MRALRDMLVNALTAHVAPRVADGLARAGRPDLAKQVSRWTVVMLGTSRLLDQLDGTPSVDEVRALCWALGAELSEMGDPTAAVFLALAEGPAEELDLRKLVPRLDAAMEDVSENNGLRAANKIAAVWRVLRQFTVSQCPSSGPGPSVPADAPAEKKEG